MEKRNTVLQPESSSPPKDAKGLAILGSMSLIPLVLHLATNGNYGIFRDELYYIACSEHLAWGYVDHPPFSIALLAAVRGLFGDSVHAIRFLPALAGAALVFMTGLMARELGGRLFAQVLAALGAMISPSYLTITGFFSMNAFDLVFWAAAFLILIRIIRTGNSKLWMLFGLVAGLGLLNKLSMAVLGLSVVVALALTPHRRHFTSRYLWIGGAIAIALFLPHLLWQAAHDWPTREFVANAKSYKIAQLSPIAFFLGQALENHPMNLPLWLAGLGSLLFWRRQRDFRALGILYLAAFVFFAAQKSKVYYLTSAYPILYAAGACAVEQWLAAPRLRWARGTLAAAFVLAGGALLPYTVPILSPETFLRYQEAIGLTAPAAETGEQAAMPQHYADRFGWENMVRAAAQIYAALSPEEQADCAILGSNYGESGAVDYFGPDLGLPAAIGRHNNYHLWGYGETSGNMTIALGFSKPTLAELFENVTPAARVRSEFAMPEEAEMTIYLCRGLKRPLDEVWAEIKNFI